MWPTCDATTSTARRTISSPTGCFKAPDWDLDLVTSYDQVLRVEGAVNHLGETGLYLHFSQPF
jgi:hypothetical protein